MAESSETVTGRRCRALSIIAESMNAGAKYEGVLDAILHAFVEQLGYKAAVVREIDAERRTLVLARALGLSDAYLAKGSVELDKSALDREALAGEVVAIEDVRTDPRFQYPQAAAEEGIGGVLAAPLAVGDEVMGVLRVYTAEPFAPTVEDKLFLMAIARLTARALINVRRYHTVSNISRQILSSPDLQQVLTAILRHSVTDLNYKGGIIRLLDRSGQFLELVAATGLSQAYLSKGGVAIERSGMDQAILQGRRVMIYDIASESGFQYPDEAVREGIRSVLSMPLTVVDRTSGASRVIGVFRVYSAQPRRFSRDESAFLQIIANLGAVAIENARLFDELNRQVQCLQPEEEGWQTFTG
jgi:GAF domain-containing protein